MQYEIRDNGQAVDYKPLTVVCCLLSVDYSISTEKVSRINFRLYAIKDGVIAPLRQAQDVLAYCFDFDNSFNKSKFPAIKASFFALDQPFSCLSRWKASG